MFDVSPMLLGLFCILGMFVLMLLGIPIVYSLAFSSVIAGLIAYGGSVLPKVGWTPFQVLFNLAWTPLPLFVLLGSLISETDIGKDVFNSLMKWLSRIPGGLIIASIWGEAIMAASLGTSTACIMVVGKMAVPEFDRHHYNRPLSLGALLAGGLLGPLIPPSATMIIYATLTNTSLGKLFIAGVIPGVVLAFMLCIPAAVISILKPSYAPALQGVRWKERFTSLKKVWPIVAVIFSILGTIYLGVATPTEAAGVGCVVVLIIAILAYSLRWGGLRRAAIESALINGMILFILVWATFFTYIVGSANVAKFLLNFVGSTTMAPIIVIIIMNIIYLLLGFVMDPITTTFLTIPIFYPIVVGLGYDPIWFGILFVVNTQIGLITPPMAVDLFAVKTVFNIPTGDLIRGVTPFLITAVIFLAILIAFPQLTLWLPAQMAGK